MTAMVLRRLLIGSVLLVATAAPAAARQPGETFRDCDNCPQMTVVPPGTVAVGDPENYDGDADPARPKATIAKAFALGTYEVTQAEWQALMGDNPSDLKGPTLPVTNVTWRAVQDYLARLKEKTGKPYRLPTETEWEYAARAGSSAAYTFGEDRSQLARFGWFDANSQKVVQPVGKLQPNGFGLYDMHGNVWEWTADCYTSNFAPTLSSDAIPNFENFCYRVIRGGSVLNYPQHVTSFYRSQLFPVNFNTNLGFRVALPLE